MYLRGGGPSPLQGQLPVHFGASNIKLSMGFEIQNWCDLKWFPCTTLRIDDSHSIIDYCFIRVLTRQTGGRQIAPLPLGTHPAKQVCLFGRVCLSVSDTPSVRLSLNICLAVSVCLFANCLRVWLSASVCLSVRLSFSRCRSVRLSVISVCLSVFLDAWLEV